MAAGGYKPKKQGGSEPRRRPNWQRSVSSDHNDVQNLNSLSGDVRINNWDVTNFGPSNLDGRSKHGKRSKGNPQRERERSLSAESPPSEKKHHTPSSYPRTKMTTNTSASQRVALESLKQHMTFSDVEDDQVSLDGERNNERQVSHVGHRLRNGSFTGADSDSEGDVMEARGSHASRNNSIQYSSNDEQGVTNQSEGVSRGNATTDGEVMSDPKQELQNILRRKQQELQDLMSHQDELNIKFRETTKKLTEAKARDNMTRTSLATVTAASQQLLEHRHPALQTLEAAVKGAILGMSEDKDEEEIVEDRQPLSSIATFLESDQNNDNSSIHEIENLPNRLIELTHQLNYLKNEFSQISETPMSAEGGQQTLGGRRQQLQNKLHELDNKKCQLDSLLQQLHVIPSQLGGHLRNNETNSQPANIQPAMTPASNMPTTRQVDKPAAPTFSGNMNLPPSLIPANLFPANLLPANLHGRENVGAAEYLHRELNEAPSQTSTRASTLFARLTGEAERDRKQEAKEKSRCLVEVREQLNHLQNLVHYYQDRKDEMVVTTDQDDSCSSPNYHDGGWHAGIYRQTKGQGCCSLQERDQKQKLQQQQRPQQQNPQLQQHTHERKQQSRHLQRIQQEKLQNLRPPLHLHQQPQGKMAAITTAPSSHNMQLLNFADVKGSPNKQWGCNKEGDQRHQDLGSRQGPEDYELLLQQTPSDRDIKGPASASLEGRLTSLTAAVETLLKRSEMEERTIKASINQKKEHSDVGGLQFSVQDQLLQSQSVMVTIGQFVQSLTLQQVDIQHLQQQMHTLQLQAQAIFREHSNSMCLTPGRSIPNSLRPPQPTLVASDCSLQTPASVSSHTLTCDHQPMPSPLAQRSHNSTISAGLCGSSSASSPGLRIYQHDGFSARSLPQSVGRRPSGVPCALGVDHTISTGSNLSIPHQRIPTPSFTNLMGQQSLNHHHHKLPKEETPVLGKAPDCCQFSNILRSSYRSSEGTFKDSQCRSSGQPDQRNPAGNLSQVNKSLQAGNEDSVPRQCAYFFEDSMNKKRSTINDGDRNTLFDSVRDTLYTEVASLISQNESRPYFLLELFRDLRHIDSDFMRRRMLHSMQELLRSKPKVNNMAAFPVRYQEEITAGKSRTDALSRNGAKPNALFDYAEEVMDAHSSLTTPTNEDETVTFQNSRFDLQQLDKQVKDIMMAAVPVVKDRIRDVCSVQLLGYIKSLVISWSNQIGDQEFVRLFHQQLACKLDSTLQKYEGQTMKKCGEDLLMDLSEVLYNELAFFRLMQSLDDHEVAGKTRTTEWPIRVARNENSSGYSASSSSCGGPDDKSDDSNKGSRDDNGMLEDKRVTSRFRTEEIEREDVLCQEDDVTAARETVFRDVEENPDVDDDDECKERNKAALDSSGVKNIGRVGSDEENDVEDDRVSINDPVTRASIPDLSVLSGHIIHPSSRPETEGAQIDESEKQDLDKPTSPSPVNESNREENDAVSNSQSLLHVHTSQTHEETAEKENVNESHEEHVTEDLSGKLIAAPQPSEPAGHNDPAEMRRKYEEEQRTLNGLDSILASLGGMEELAGDEASVLDPDFFQF